MVSTISIGLKNLTKEKKKRFGCRNHTGVGREDCHRHCRCLFICVLVSVLVLLLLFFNSIICYSFSVASPYHTIPTATHLRTQLQVILTSTEASRRRKTEGVLVFLKCFLGSRMRKSPRRRLGDDDDDDDDSKKLSEKDESCTTTTTAAVRRFSWGEIEKITENFSQVIGSGGFSTVYMGRITGSGLGAFKVNYGSERLNRVFKQELNILLHLQHENIVKLIGYCDDREEGVLVFEYISNGSLQEKLHGANAKKTSVLSWKSRMAIAYQLAKSIEYLHEQCTPHIVHCDIKASNILLDDHLKSIKLCDFGSAKMGFASSILPPSSCNSPSKKNVSPMRQMMMMGSPGYVDPHYLKTGIASKKNDIYGFGVVLLELITGKEAFCSEKHQQLTKIMDPLLNNGEPGGIDVAKIVDPKLGGSFNREEIKAMTAITAQCLRHLPGHRPSSTEILQTMKQKVSSISSLLI